MKLSREQKLELCLKIFRPYKPMSEEEDAWYDSLPHGLDIDYPFDSSNFFQEVLLIICNVNFNREEADMDLLDWFNAELQDREYTEQDFIYDINYLLDKYEEL